MVLSDLIILYKIFMNNLVSINKKKNIEVSLKNFNVYVN